MPKSDYLLYQKLIDCLFNAEYPFSKARLADCLGVSSKTIKRLKDSINTDEPLIEEVDGVNGGYFINTKNKDLFIRKTLSSFFVNCAQLKPNNIDMYVELFSIIANLNSAELEQVILKSKEFIK